MTIKKLYIENVRSIRQLTTEDPILKNRPTILVAPNGFGKTSIATAFKSAIEKTSIEIRDEDRHQHNPLANAKIEPTHEENQVASVFKVEEKAQRQSAIEPITICPIKRKKPSPFTKTMFHAGMGKHKGVLPDINAEIFGCHTTNRCKIWNNHLQIQIIEIL